MTNTGSSGDEAIPRTNDEIYREDFQQIVASLIERITPDNYEELPGYLGKGNNGPAYKIEKDGTFYAAQLLFDDEATHFKLQPLLKSIGIEHTAQLTCYSLESNVIVTELLPGKPVDEIPFDLEFEYPEQHVIQLIETVKQLHSKGLMLDPSKMGNFLYDTEKGFSILDLNVIRHENEYTTLPQQVMYLKNILVVRKYPLSFSDIDYDSPGFEETIRKQSLIRYSSELPALISFIEILEDHYPDLLEEWKQTKPVPLLPLDYVPADPALDKSMQILIAKGVV